MFSMPPATTMSASPASIIWAAMLTQFRPEPQTTLTVTAGVSMGRAGLQGSLTSDVLAQTGLDDAAHVDMVDLLRLDVGAVQSLLDDDGAQLSGGDIGEGAAELANGSTAGAGDDDLFHK